MVTREELQERRADLMQDYTMVVGHLQEVDYWLAKLGEEPPPETPGEPEPEKEK